MTTFIKRMTAVVLALAAVLAFLPAACLPVHAATGYDRGYTGAMAGDGKIYAHGLDVSSWQGESLDFKNFKNAGYEYVILRCGTTKGKDTCFETFYTKAKDAGLDVGAYYYSYATTVAAAKADAANMISWMSGKTFEYPIYFDYEDSSQGGIDDATAAKICYAFMDTLRDAGYLVGLYSMSSWLEKDWVTTSGIRGTYEGWVAHYPSTSSNTGITSTVFQKYHSTYSSRYGMYQYSSSTYVNGAGPFDANVCYKDYPTIVETYGFNGYSGGTSLKSVVFDAAYYAAKYEELVQVLGTDEAVLYDHFLKYGIKEGRQASPNFDIAYYLANNTFVQEAIGSTTDYVAAYEYFLEKGYKKQAVTAEPANLGESFYARIRFRSSKNLSLYATNVIIYPESEAPAQVWQFTRQENGSYKIVNTKNSLTLEAAGSAKAPETNVELAVGDGSSGQSWYLYQSGDRYIFQPTCSSYCVMDVTGASTEDLTNVQIDVSDNGTSQLFRILQVDYTGGEVAADIGDVVYVKLSNVASGNFMGIGDTNVQSNKEATKAAQVWRFAHQDDGSYRVVNQKTGKVLEVAGGTDADGTNVQVAKSNDSTAQRWYVYRCGDYYTLRPAMSSTCRLEVAEGSSEHGANIQIGTQTLTDEQLFTITQVEYLEAITPVTIGQEFYAKLTNSASEKDVDLDSNNVISNTAAAVSAQVWRFVLQEDGSYHIINQDSGKLLDLATVAGEDGTNVRVRKSNDTASQNWFLYEFAGKYLLRSAGSETCVMTVADGAATDGTNIRINAFTGLKAQRFAINKVDFLNAVSPVDLGNTFYSKITNTASGMNLGLDGENVILYQSIDNASQVWQFILQNDGSYHIINQKGGLLMNVADAAAQPGTNVNVRADAETTAQHWFVYLKEGSYLLQSACAADCVVNIESGVMENATSIEIATADFSDAQLFAIEAMEYSNTISYLPACDEGQTALADALKTVGVEAVTDEYLMRLAIANYRQDYAYTDAENAELLALLKERSLIDPADTLLTGWYTFSDGNRYYYDETGAKVYSWLTAYGKTYYLDPATGAMTTGIRQIDGEICKFDDNGVLIEKGICHHETHDPNGICTNCKQAVDHSYEVSVTAPSCSTAGYTTHTCSVCGYSYADGHVSALGHHYTSVVIAPTCTRAGYTSHTCTTCGSGYTSGQISATGHSYTSQVIAPGCAAGGYTKHTCTVCGDSYVSDEVAALGHGDVTYSFVNNTHTFTCTVCNEVAFTKASTDGKQLKFRSAAPLLGDCINVEFGIEVPAGFENVYVVFDFIGKQTKVDSYYVNASGRYVFEFPGINPQTIGENISSTVYATVDGVEVSLTYATYSVRTYCGNQLSKATVSAALKTLIADLLIFGEKTQIVQNYKTDELITAGMDLTPYASTFPGLGTEFNKQQMVGTANAAVGFKGVTLTLSGKMTIVVSLTADDISKYTFQAEVNGVVTTYQPEDLVYNATSGRYELSFDKMKASAFDDVITFSILENGVVTSKQLQYSVNSYIQKNQAVATGDMLALLQAIYNYGAAAKALNG